jgi:hypothetical protein
LLLGLPPAGAEDISLRETADAFPRSLLASLRGLLRASRPAFGRCPRFAKPRAAEGRGITVESVTEGGGGDGGCERRAGGRRYESARRDRPKRRDRERR